MKRQILFVLSLSLAAGAIQAQTSTSAILEIQSLMQNHTSRGDEKRILEILRELPPAALNEVLTGLDLHELFEDMDNRRLGPRNRTAILRLLCAERVQELSISSRAAVITALQDGHTNELEESAIVELFLSAPGLELTRLKNAIDAGSDHHDLHQLIFRDIDNTALQSRMLQHIQEQARLSEKSVGLKILSDIDDTVYANWKDARYPKKTIYPGMRQLYAQLDLGPFEEQMDAEGDLVFLTARFTDRPGLMETGAFASLQRVGFQSATVLTGSVLKLFTNEEIAEKKFQNFKEFLQLYPEYRFVWIGDSGQGDAIAGQAMRAFAPSHLLAAWIHDVENTPLEVRAEWASKGVIFFDTYAGAAVHAYRLGLISRTGLRRVVDAALQEMAGITFDTQEKRAAMEELLHRDASLARLEPD